MPGTASQMVQNVIPRYQAHINVLAWGHRNTPRRLIRELAIGVAISKLGMPLTGRYNSHARLTEDIMGKFVDFELVYEFGNLRRILQSVGGWPQLEAMQHHFTDNEDVFSGNGIVASRNLIGNPVVTGTNGSRGTWLGNMVAEALQSACSVPARPANGRNVYQTFR